MANVARKDLISVISGIHRWYRIGCASYHRYDATYHIFPSCAQASVQARKSR